MKFSVYVVGSNPLPVGIALCYDCGLVKPDRKSVEPHKALFFYSEQTECYFQNIQTWVTQKQLPLEMQGFYLADVHNSRAVYTEIKEAVERYLALSQDLSEIFLNTTGGTKVMSANTVLALMDVVKEKNLSANILKEADIDPDNGIIYVFNPIEKSEVDTFPVGQDIGEVFQDNITIDDIVMLYNYKKSETKQTLDLYNTEKTIEFGERILANIEGYRAFQDIVFGIKTVFETKEKLNNYNVIINQLDMCKEMLSQPTDDEELNRFGKFLCKNKNIDKYVLKPYFNFYKNTSEQAKNIYQLFSDFHLINTDKDDIMTKHDFEFITGIWFEQYIWAILASLTQENKRYEIIHSLKICPNDSGSGSNFEIDLAFRNGYDITFISCTTDSNHELAKSKTNQVLSNSECLGLRTKTMLISMCDKSSEFFTERYRAFSAQFYKEQRFLCFESLIDKENLTSELKCILKIH